MSSNNKTLVLAGIILSFIAVLIYLYLKSDNSPDPDPPINAPIEVFITIKDYFTKSLIQGYDIRVLINDNIVSTPGPGAWYNLISGVGYEAVIYPNSPVQDQGYILRPASPSMPFKIDYVQDKPAYEITLLFKKQGA